MTKYFPFVQLRHRRERLKGSVPCELLTHCPIIHSPPLSSSPHRGVNGHEGPRRT